MEGHDFIPCSAGVAWLHVFLACIGSFTTIATTWLVARAKARDKKEAERNGNER